MPAVFSSLTVCVSTVRAADDRPLGVATANASVGEYTKGPTAAYKNREVASFRHGSRYAMRSPSARQCGPLGRHVLGRARAAHDVHFCPGSGPIETRSGFSRWCMNSRPGQAARLFVDAEAGARSEGQVVGSQGRSDSRSDSPHKRRSVYQCRARVLQVLSLGLSQVVD
jgi:hypothetical protein